MAREVAAKIVFYGPGLSGKTTTLKKIHQTVRPEHRGEMMSLPTEADRTLFFDFLPVKVERVGDCSVRLALYTVPGQVFYNATRRLVLQGADGVVFVADSQPEAVDSNCESFKNLEENLLEQGIRLDQFPLVIQYNKRDIPKALPLEQLRGMLNPSRVPDFETCATDGRGVLDGLKTITRLVIKDLRNKKVVLPPRADAIQPRIAAMVTAPADMQDQISQQLEAAEAQPRLWPAAALAPEPLLDYARAADLAYASGDIQGCIRSCQEATRRALHYAGEGSVADQGYLLGVNGSDLLKLLGLSTLTQLRPKDGSFALYVLMQVLIRLAASGLPAPEPRPAGWRP
jgi:signal recognition particle receptor subunit beta